MLTTSVVGSPVVSRDRPAELEVTGEIADLPTWPVTIAYFDETENNDGTPVYRISFKLYENGVTRDLTMDYGEFALKGTLANLELFEPESLRPESTPSACPSRSQAKPRRRGVNNRI